MRQEKNRFGGFTLRDLWRAQNGGKCFHCAEQMDFSPHRSRKSLNGWTREHLVPRSCGGKNVFNIVLAHQWCNSARGSMLPTAEELERAYALWEKAAEVATHKRRISYKTWKEQFDLTQKGEQHASHDG
jgi:5-methylcytosine-specific restriction endonuclease McrA